VRSTHSAASPSRCAGPPGPDPRRHPDVRTVRATVSPDDEASLALVTSYGFVENGYGSHVRLGRVKVVRASVQTLSSLPSAPAVG
jgi:hypothetical protein